MLTAFFVPQYVGDPVVAFALGPLEEPIAVVDEIHQRHRVAARRRDPLDRDVDDRAPARELRELGRELVELRRADRMHRAATVDTRDARDCR